MKQIKNTRDGIRCKIIGYSAVFLLAIFASFFAIRPENTFALGDCEAHDVIIRSNGDIGFDAGSIDGKTVSFNKDNNKLTLDGFNGGSICSERDLKIVLKGNNYTGIDKRVTLFGNTEISGDGTLNADGSHFEIPDNSLTVSGGTLNLLDYNDERAKPNHYGTDIKELVISGGTINSEVSIRVKQLSQPKPQSQSQPGGKLNIRKQTTVPDDGKDGAEYYCLLLESDGDSSMVFDGGVVNIDCGDAPAIVVEGYYDVNGLPAGMVLFNGGDITLKSDVSAIVAIARVRSCKELIDTYYCEDYNYEGIPNDFLIKVSDRLQADVENYKIKSFVEEYPDMYDDEMRLHLFSALTNGDGEFELSGDSGVVGYTASVNVIRRIHFTQKDEEPTDPGEDQNVEGDKDEENKGDKTSGTEKTDGDKDEKNKDGDKKKGFFKVPSASGTKDEGGVKGGNHGFFTAEGASATLGIGVCFVVALVLAFVSRKKTKKLDEKYY